MTIKRNRDGSYSAFQRIGSRVFVAEGENRWNAMYALLAMIIQPPKA